jgi:hypothetical protein
MPTWEWAEIKDFVTTAKLNSDLAVLEHRFNILGGVPRKKSTWIVRPRRRKRKKEETGCGITMHQPNRKVFIYKINFKLSLLKLEVGHIAFDYHDYANSIDNERLSRAFQCRSLCYDPL